MWMGWLRMGLMNPNSMNPNPIIIQSQIPNTSVGDKKEDLKFNIPTWGSEVLRSLLVYQWSNLWENIIWLNLHDLSLGMSYVLWFLTGKTGLTQWQHCENFDNPRDRSRLRLSTRITPLTWARSNDKKWGYAHPHMFPKKTLKKIRETNVNYRWGLIEIWINKGWFIHE